MGLFDKVRGFVGGSTGGNVAPPPSKNLKPGDPNYLDWLRNDAPPPAGYDYGYEVGITGRPEVGLFKTPSGGGGGGGGGDGGASIAASLRGQDLDYQLGLKGVEVDWARVGVDREQMGINRQLARTQQGEHAEMTRANKVGEAEKARQRALDAASNAMSAYMTGTQLADARRLASFQEARSLLPHLVDPNQQFQAGYEPGGPLATATARFGLPPMTPQRIQKKRLRPGDLAKAPSNQQIGGGIMSGIKDIKRAGNAPAKAKK